MSKRSRSFHWVITLQWQEGLGGLRTRSMEGTVDVSPDASRQDVFRDVLKEAAEHFHASDPIVLFFSLEPNDLRTAR